MKSILFIHRSVGQNLLDDGRLAIELEAAAKNAGISVDFSDINNNNEHTIPGIDTKPHHYLDFFSRKALPNDLVIIKSCYPNNAIKSNKDLEQIKKTYKELVRKYLENSKGRLLILTTPPLRPICTSNAEAGRARRLATWLSNEAFDKRVKVFNLYDLLAEPDNSGKANTLRKMYRKLLPWDNHPNKKASRTISAMLTKTVIEFLN